MNNDDKIIKPKKQARKHTFLGVLLVVFLLAATSITVIETYPSIWSNMQEGGTSYNIWDWGSIDYSLYVKLMEEKKGITLEPTDVFLPGFTKERARAEGLYDSFFESVAMPVHEANQRLDKYYFQYCIQDLETTTIVEKNSSYPIGHYFTEPFDETKIAETYLFFAVVSYNESGKITVINNYGSTKSELEDVLLTNSPIANLENGFEPDSAEYLLLDNLTIEKPKNMQMVVGITKDFLSSDDYYSLLTSNYWNYSFLPHGLSFVLLLAVFLVGLMGLVLPGIKRFKIGTEFVQKIPFEVNVIVLFLLAESAQIGANIALSTASGLFVTSLEKYSFQSSYATGLVWCLNFVAWFLYLGAFFMIATSLRQIFTLGLKRYIKEKTLLGFVIRWGMKQTKMGYDALTTYDFKTPINKVVFKLVGLNFIILLVMCSVWFFGIPFLIIYSFFLFYYIRKYLEQTKAKLEVLLNATREIAGGNMNVEIVEDLGMFDPLKEELITIKEGLKKAVGEEVKSQQMKTELITNVSHDLKTPLTAIITYLDLLKGENITTQQRTDYIQTLEHKSFRLKKLIEDLFEISKINSNNIELNLGSVDIIALIKQVQFELEDKIKETALQFKINLPQEKILLTLDGQKTYRIFENLFINILKYALPSTRAYVDITDTKQEVTITLKNISNEELNFNTEEITDRFVRGDKSRNTEGSGLGLAIVKSFVEVQGGQFIIDVDGDLFKAIVIFPK